MVWPPGRGGLWQQSICWVFILLSGFCLPLGHHPVKRGAAVFGCRRAGHGGDAAVHACEDVVWFGVLTLLGSAMLLTGLAGEVAGKGAAGGGAGRAALFLFALHPLTRCRWLLGAGPVALGAAAGRSVRQLPHGLPGLLPGLVSSPADYFPLLPWLFLFWAGFYLHPSGRPQERLEPLRRSVCPPLGWLGRHSLVLYLLHQPVIFGVLTLVFTVPQLL